MTIRRVPIASLCFLFLISGCSLLISGDDADDSPVDPLAPDPELLVGRWEWQSSTYYFTMDGESNKVTPASAGYTETLEFSEDGTVATYRDGVLEERESYEVRKRQYPNGMESDSPMLFIGEEGSAEFGVNQETLRISTAFKDGPESIYARQN